MPKLDTPIPEARAIERWLRTVDGFAAAKVVEVGLAEGGVSNITCRVGLEGARWGAIGLKLERERGIFEPYDVIREGRVLRALGATAIPVPEVLALGEDASVLGARFVAMEWIDAPHMGVAGPGGDFGAFVAMVATIHGTAWRGLLDGILPLPSGAEESIGWEIAAVARRIRALGTAEALLVEAGEALAKRIPADGELRLCQGDINVFNFLFRAREVVAVVDWEQARIGDARSDIGQLLALSHLKGAAWGPAGLSGMALAYGAAAGAELRGLEFFRAFWLWQLAVIHRGWVALNGSEPWYTWEEVTGLLGTALAETAG
ncbi:MAG: phosphotransferase family protein [Dehalococcoidia bacterium]